MKAELLLFGPCFFTLTILAQPSITQEPSDQVANQGYAATFQVRASGGGGPPLNYVWLFNQAVITNAVANKFTITNAMPFNAGNYFAIVSDSNGSVTSRVATLRVIPPAILDPKIGPNLRLGEDPSKLPASNTSEAEIHIARDPLDSKNLLATFQEARQPSGGGLAMGYAISHNGGLSWERGLLPRLGHLLGEADNVSDSVAAFDLSGTAYINSLDNSMGALALSKLTNGATSFSNPRFLVASSADTWPDKIWLAINTFSNSPTVNRIVMTWTEYNGAGTKIFGLRSALSDTGGSTWSKPIYITRKEDQNTQPLFLPDGSLAVLFVDFDTDDRIQMSFSKDGGLSYETNRTVAPIWTYADPQVRNPGYIFSANTDRQRGILYVAYQSRLDKDTNSPPAIMFTRSIDRGLRWTMPVAVNDTPNKKSVFIPAIAVSPDGQHVVIEFYDRRNDTGSGYLVDLYVAESFDGGETWEQNLRVSEFTTDMRNAPLTTSGGGGYMYGDYQAILPSMSMQTPAVAAWIDARSGSSDPFVAHIQRTRGTTFETWRKLRWNTSDLTNLAVSGPAADPDGDGIPNFAEYAAGLEPDHPDPGFIQTRLLDSGSFLRLTFPHPNDPRLATDVELGWEESPDLVHWAKATTYPKQAPPNSDDVLGFWRSWVYPVEPHTNKWLRLVAKPAIP